MLSALSPVHLMLVLWLFAAAVPAATVLMNGSLAPFGSARIEEKAQAHAESRATVATRSRTPASSHRALPACEATAAQIATLGVLHTAVQRHRPRA